MECQSIVDALFKILVQLLPRLCSLSKEGVPQGDPLGLMFYAIALLPLTRKLKNGSAFLLERAELLKKKALGPKIGLQMTHHAYQIWNLSWNGFSC